MILEKQQKSDRVWKKINTRAVTHLLGVEFIHNLYNRHLPRVNAIRFRNTKTIWKDGRVVSYAPKKEWDILENWLGEKFFRLDPILLKETKSLIKINRDFLLDFFNRLEKSKLEKEDERGLGIILIDLQEFVLGEIYKINVVQIEHALTHALLKLISEKVAEKEEQLSILSKITAPKKITESQKEHIKFLRILKLGKKIGVSLPKKSRFICWLIKKHADRYRFMYCAYGENPRNMKFYISQYEKMHNDNESQKKIKRNIKVLYSQSEKILKNLGDRRIKTLARLMSKIGTFRDKNKAFLGQTIKYRFRILNEIAKRGLEKRGTLNFYLLSEILQLLDKKERVLLSIIEKRKKNGVVLTRSEYMETGVCFNLKNKKTSGIRGNCASQGIVRGICKVVLNNKDAYKIEKGDIMVSPGTDFDLMEAIIKSAGVITEEGGLLSHASVVCREMLKPCCISVKNATEILRDGLFIELNATKGKVKILKR